MEESETNEMGGGGDPREKRNAQGKGEGKEGESS